MAKKPRDFQVSEIPSFGDFELPSQPKQKYLHKGTKSSVRMVTLLSEFPSFRDSEFLRFRVSEIPSLRDSESLRFRVSEIPSFRDSEFLRFRVRVFEIPRAFCGCFGVLANYTSAHNGVEIVFDAKHVVTCGLNRLQ